MSRHWREKFDHMRHVDFMSTTRVGGIAAARPRDPLIPQTVYFVEVAAFVFQFQSLEQLRQALDYFRQKIQPTSHGFNGLEHYWQEWFERLPQWLFEEPKRKKVVVALERALGEFEKD